MSGDRPKHPVIVPPRPRERVKTDPMIDRPFVDRALVHHESRRAPPDPTTAARLLEESEARRRASMVDRHEKELEHREGAWQGFARHVLETQRDTNATLVVFARHLGLEDKLPPRVVASNRPPAQTVTPAPTVPKLDVIGKDAKAGTQATYVAVVLGVLTIVNTSLLIILELLKRGH